MSKAATTQKAQRGGIMASIAKATTKSTPTTATPARKSATANVATTTASVTPPATPAVRPTFNWATMPAPEVVVYHKAVAKTDVEGTTPEEIKSWVKDGFDKTALAGKPVYTAVVFPSVEMAAEAVKLAKRYATFKGYTLRGGIDKAEPARVSIAVKVRETRTRKAA